MSTVLQVGGFTDHGIVLKWQLPLSSRRLDCMITGQDHHTRPNAVIVELKQWEEAERSSVDDCVVTFVGRYLHNLVYAESSELFDSRHADVLASNPLFAGDQVDSLADFLELPTE